MDHSAERRRHDSPDIHASNPATAPGKKPRTANLAPRSAGNEASAAPAIQRKPAAGAGTVAGMDTAMRPDLHGAPVQRLAEDGISGGKVTLQDFLGTESTDEERAGAAQSAEADNTSTLAEQAAAIATGTARSERDMLLAIESGNAPHFIARVGPRKNFGYGTFANPSRPFVFATEPADLRGCKPAEAMYKVGWTKEWIAPNIGQEIVVCIFDTTQTVAGGDGARAKVEQGKMEWPELTAAALADQNFLDAAEARGIDAADLPELLRICSETPVKGQPRTSDPDKQRNCLIVRELIDSLYGANALYTGMGATMREDGQLGGREVMIKPNGTGLKLTSDNHTIVSLGTLTQEDYDALP